MLNLQDLIRKAISLNVTTKYQRLKSAASRLRTDLHLSQRWVRPMLQNLTLFSKRKMVLLPSTCLHYTNANDFKYLFIRVSLVTSSY